MLSCRNFGGTMRRRQFVSLLGSAAVAWPFAALSVCLQQVTRAQGHKVPFLGWLTSAPGSDPSLDAFHAGLRELDYVEGRSIRVDARSAQDNAELRALARELVRQQADVIVTNGRAATRAAQEAPAAASWRGDTLLLSYAADNAHLQHRAASYVDRLLKGAKPADLPIEQTTKF